MKLELTPIGLIHSPHREAEGTPIQPRWAAGIEGTVEVFSQFAPGLRDLDGFDRVWLFYWFDRARAVQLEVVPSLDTQTRGVFATPGLAWVCPGFLRRNFFVHCVRRPAAGTAVSLARPR